MVKVAPSRAEELERLIRQQSADDNLRRLPALRHTIRESELTARSDRDHPGRSVGLDAIPSRQLEPWQRVAWIDATRNIRALPFRTVKVVGLDTPWGAEHVHYDPSDGTPCPECSGSPPADSICGTCHASDDDRTPWPMQPTPKAKRRAALAGGIEKGKFHAELKARRSAARAKARKAG